MKKQAKEEEPTKVAEKNAPEAASVIEEAKLEYEKDVVEVAGEEEEELKKEEKKADVEKWTPKTSIGALVKAGKITDVDVLLEEGRKILEQEIVDALLPNLEIELLMIGQSKGKFGGGQRRIFRQTQKKTPEGNKPSFACFAAVGNLDGYVGAGYGKSKDTVPSREKAIRNAKLNVFKIKRGCGSWECGCRTPHSIPFTVSGKCGSVEITLMPAPKGKGLCVETECAKMLRLTGIKDVWSRTEGKTRNKQNLIIALVKALKKLSEFKLKPEIAEAVGLAEGRVAA